MSTIPASSPLALTPAPTSLRTLRPLRKLLSWADRQEGARLFWSALALGSLGCVFAPVATILVCLSGMHPAFIVIATLSMVISMVPNLAAMPTRTTIPLFFLSVLIDLAIIGAALAHGCHFARIFTQY